MSEKLKDGIRPSPIFYLILLTTFLGGYFCLNPNIGSFTVPARLAIFITVTGGWIISLILHEFAHAYVAWKAGDISVAAKGYLTLNPLKYMHPVLSIVIPVAILLIGGIGLPGGAVWIDHSKLSPQDRSVVSAAGPITSLITGLVVLLPFAAGIIFKPITVNDIVNASSSNSSTIALQLALIFLGSIILISFVINILPIPGLDGFGIMEPYLSPEARSTFNSIRPYSLFILLGGFYLFGQYLWIPVDMVLNWFGVDSVISSVGYSCYTFWESDTICPV